MARGVADGAPLVKCQLLASAFYEKLRKAYATKRSTLLAVTDQCHRSAAANISPVQALAELKRAIDLLDPEFISAGSKQRCVMRSHVRPFRCPALTVCCGSCPGGAP